MIRVLFLLIVSFISITTFGQKPFKYAGRGIQMTEMWGDSVVRIPSDTVRNKNGIACIGSRFFVGNGIYWKEIAGGSGTGANIYNSSGTLIGARILDMNGNTLTFTNSAAPADMLFDNGTQFIEMSTTHDWVNIFNSHTSLKVIDGINVNMVNTGTASMRTDSLPQNQQRIYQFPNRAGTIALTSDTAGLRELIGGKVDSVTFTSSTCVDTINIYRAGVKTQKTFDKVNGLLSGGEVTPGANDTTFNVAAAVYNAQCVRYTSDATPITLNGNSDSAKGRIDVIYTQAGNVGAIQGQNLTNPIAPALTASQIGLATVYFPPLSDSGITNIYNITNVNGIDSSAIRSVAVTADSSAFIFTSLRRVDTIYTSRSTAIDSLRRLAGSTNVQARKGGVWITQFTDSVGSGGGGSQNLDQVLAVGNNTDTTINFVDTLSSNEGKQFVTIYPKGYGQTGYPNGRPAMFSGLGYKRYPGVNADGRPNVVGLLWGYNGGFNNKVIAGEPTWGVRTETWYQISGAGNSEFHGVSPEFQPINGTASRRLGTWYVRNSDGYSTFISQGDQYNWYRGASDTTMFGISSTGMGFGSKGVGSFSIKNTDSASNFTNIALGLNGTSFSNTVSAGAQPLNTFSFLSPISVAPGTSYGSSSSYWGLVNTNVAVAGKYGFAVTSTGLTTSSYGGLIIDGNTTGTITPLYGRNTSATGTVSSVMIGGNGSTAAWMLRDNSVGIDWRMYLKSGDADKQLKIGFGTSTYDSLMKFRGTDGKVSIRTSLNVGAAAYPVASAALEVTSTTQGFLPPRMTATQAGAISSPAEGLIVYVTNTDGTFTAKGWWGWDGAAWQKLNN